MGTYEYVMTCSSGYCGAFPTIFYYYELGNTYEAVADSFSHWDGSVIPLFGTSAGVQQQFCSIVTNVGDNSDSSLCWADYDAIVTFQVTVGAWTAQGDTVFQDLYGGNIDAVTYLNPSAGQSHIVQSGGDYCGTEGSDTSGCSVNLNYYPGVGDTIVVEVVLFNDTTTSFGLGDVSDQYLGTGGPIYVSLDGMNGGAVSACGSSCYDTVGGNIAIFDVGYIQVSDEAVQYALIEEGIAFSLVINAPGYQGCNSYNPPACGVEGFGVFYYEVRGIDTGDIAMVYPVAGGSIGSDITSQTDNIPVTDFASFWSMLTVSDSGAGNIVATGPGWESSNDVTAYGTTSALTQWSVSQGGESTMGVTGTGYLDPASDWAGIMVGFGIGPIVPQFQPVRAPAVVSSAQTLSGGADLRWAQGTSYLLATELRTATQPETHSPPTDNLQTREADG